MCSIILLTFSLLVAANAEFQFRNEIQALAEQIEILKSLHLTDVTKLKREIRDLKEHTSKKPVNSHDRNEQVTLQWAKASMKELRSEMRELSDSVNNSILLHQLHTIRNELKQALTETSDLAHLARTQEARVDNLDNEVGRIKYEGQQMRSNLADLRAQVAKLNKELKHAQLEQLNSEAYNDVIVEEDGARMIQLKPTHAHKLRHSKMVHEQIARLSKSQDQLDLYQQNLQTQLLDVQRQLDRFGEHNWDLVTAKLDFMDLETKVIRNELKNITQEVSDFNKIHVSLLELREDLENVENKADKTIPEFRKEISKLDVGFAQVNAQASYLKEDQEHLRQSVKAIAVSISNAIDRAELDRLALSRLNESISDLHSFTKQHYYRLNDHILKSESTAPDNASQIIPLPELMGEVKELQPVEREYEDLVHQLPKDCSIVTGEPGTYLIRPGRVPVDAWCNNGSTLLQRRYNGSINFNLKISDYIKGFGDPASNYWFGLENMHLLTADKCTTMRIDMTDIYGGNWYAQYDEFSVGSVDTGYVLTVGGFKGNASDAFEFQNHMAFSASDVDRDNSNSDCAANYEGGWWYSHCQHVNINGKYSLGLSWFDSQRNEWIAVSTSEMTLRRRPECSALKH